MLHRNKADKWGLQVNVNEKSDKDKSLKGKCYAVYPDSVRMDLSDTNSCIAIFKHKQHALEFGNSKWQDKWILKKIEL